MRVKIVCNLAFVRTLQAAAAGSIPGEYGPLSTELLADQITTIPVSLS